ncbi:23S rRNA (adenine(2058)-N(6))-methyltransferase Erm(37) [Pseudonocardia eucalypti]|uniref:23S rRNA (Adenine(2058)-N(6))-methyltransferase Erm(37) n=1 Tax=Pseudonocardia eucalypti TaxID=648755 RepID=A0ABP9Q6D3_9PSEU|nr:23S rRNA (adenine-N6)-dimethyltransferase [Pseudonocardia eucalypti]
MPRARTRPNPSGVHLLTARRPIDQLVSAATLAPDDLVIDFGAGPGVITAALAATGARVLAVERDARFARRLSRRFDGHNVRVVHDDLRRVPLPRRPFSVVASIPFAVSTTLLRRLLGDRRVPLRGADLVVEWGFARRVTTEWPGRAETARWAARYDLVLRRRIPAASFTPPPSVDAAHLSIRPRFNLSNLG